MIRAARTPCVARLLAEELEVDRSDAVPHAIVVVLAWNPVSRAKRS